VFWAFWDELLKFMSPFSYIKEIQLVFLFQNFSVPEDLSAYDGLKLCLKGDGCRYKLIIHTSLDWDTVGYTTSFDTVAGQWQSVSDISTP
jgi:hypothetical protein